jgi:DNA-binding transcriptional ArsR family regulator
MSEQRVEPNSSRELSLEPTGPDLAGFEEILKALGSGKRLAILEYLGARTYSVLELAGALGWPPSTVTLHVNILEHAGLIHTEIRPATRGLQKVCSRLYDRVTIQIPLEPERKAGGPPTLSDMQERGSSGMAERR